MITTITDDEGRIHQATLSGHSVGWTLDGEFQRRLSYDSVLSSASTAPIDHVLFARFRGSSSTAPAIALCVFRADFLHINLHTGDKFVVALPFAVERAYALHTGVLVQRKESPGVRLPMVFSLLSPLGEFTMLGLSRSMHVQMRRSFALSPAENGQITGFTDQTQTMLGTAVSRADRSMQFVLCFDSDRLLLYRCTAAYASSAADDEPGRRVGAVRRKSLAIRSDRRSSLLGRASVSESPGAQLDAFWEHRQMRAEVVVHLCWRWRGSGDAQMCVVQALDGSDIVCVMSRGLAVGLDTRRFSQVLCVPATSMAAVEATRPGMDDLAVVSDGRLMLMCGGPEPLVVPGRSGIARIVRVEGPVVVVQMADGREAALPVSISMTRLSRSIIDALSFALARPAYAKLRHAMLSVLQEAGTADDELDCLLQVLADDELHVPAVSAALWLVYEDMALHAFEPRQRLQRLERGLVHLGMRNTGRLAVPGFASWAVQLLNGSPTMERYPDLDAISVPDAQPVAGARDSLAMLRTVSEILWHMAMQGDLSATLAPLTAMPVRLAPALQWLVDALLEMARQKSQMQWPPELLKLLGRHDLLKMLGRHDLLASTHMPSAVRKKELLTIAQLCERAIEGKEPEQDMIMAVKRQEIASAWFARDLRVDEVCRLLHSDVDLAVDVSRLESPEEIRQTKDTHLGLVAKRTLGLPVSQALLVFSTQPLNEHDALPVRPVVVSARFRGNRIKSTWTPAEPDLCWAQFHNGVASALALDRDQVAGVHASWVLLNRPADEPVGLPGEEDKVRDHRLLRASHAGVLLGLGLAGAGPLRTLPPWQAFQYLSARDGLTSVGFLLGTACAAHGTGDAQAAKLLSLHIPSLLPAGASELMLLSHGTRAAAMLGLGLVYARSQNRRMVEVALRELSMCRTAPAEDHSTRLDDADPAESSRECYALSAGFALGLLVLGQGQRTETLADLNLLDTLSAMVGRTVGAVGAESERTGRPGSAMPGAHAMPGVSDLGPVAALGLAFLGTNYRPAAHRLALPSTLQLLRTTDPFVLLWKTLMRCLIMADAITPTAAWIESTVPMPESPEPDLVRARLHITSAACFALAIKYAGSEDAMALQTLLQYFDQLHALAKRPAAGYEARLTRASAQACLNILCIACALVMAGSGSIEVMRRLRCLHAATPMRSYGDHMASHMALGLLFLGGGARLTLSRNDFSMAVLLISMFPRFPRWPADNYEHLQAWRHLWPLCVRVRVLLVRDAGTGELCRNAEIAVAGRDGKMVPCRRIPDLADVEKVQVRVSGYLPLDIDFSHEPAARDALMQHCTLYVVPLARPLPPLCLTPLRFERWLSRVPQAVGALAANLAKGVNAGLATDVLENARQLRVCVAAARHPNFALLRKGCAEMDVFHWPERVILAWADIYADVHKLAMSEHAARALTTYWSSPDAASTMDESGHTAVALMYAVLDLPAPAVVAEATKQVPLADLVNQYLKKKP